MALDFFHNFSLIILVGKRSGHWTVRPEFRPSLQGRNFKKNTVARDARLERNLASREESLVTKNARSGAKKFVTGM